MPRSPLRMPKMSMTMEEGELLTWKVAIGDKVQLGDVVCEVMTDKVDMEVEATAAGTVVELEVQEGSVVPVGTPLAWVESESDSLLDDLLGGDGTPDAAAGPEAGADAGAPQAGPADPAPDGRTGTGGPTGTGGLNGRPPTGIVPAIPAARKLALENGIELASVPGSGPDGAVLVSDVQRVLATRTAEPAPAPQAPAAAAPVVLEPAPAPVTAPVTALDVAPAPVTAPAAAWLAPRSGEGLAAPGAALWRDVVVGVQAPEPERLRATVLAAVSAWLERVGPDDVRERPRVGLDVVTGTGTVPLTFVAPHRVPFDVLVEQVREGLAQAASGRVDVRFLAPADATVTWLDDVDRVSLPPRAGTLVALALGSPAARIVAVGGGTAVRTTVTASATANARLADAATVAALLGSVAAALGPQP